MPPPMARRDHVIGASSRLRAVVPKKATPKPRTPAPPPPPPPPQVPGSRGNELRHAPAPSRPPPKVVPPKASAKVIPPKVAPRVVQPKHRQSSASSAPSANPKSAAGGILARASPPISTDLPEGMTQEDCNDLLRWFLHEARRLKRIRKPVAMAEESNERDAAVTQVEVQEEEEEAPPVWNLLGSRHDAAEATGEVDAQEGDEGGPQSESVDTVGIEQAEMDEEGAWEMSQDAEGVPESEASSQRQRAPRRKKTTHVIKLTKLRWALPRKKKRRVDSVDQQHDIAEPAEAEATSFNAESTQAPVEVVEVDAEQVTEIEPWFQGAAEFVRDEVMEGTPSAPFSPAFSPASASPSSGSVATNQCEKLALVLDVDNTLLQAAVNLPHGLDTAAFRDAGGEQEMYVWRSLEGPVFIKLRPGLRSFLASVSKLYDLYIVTQGEKTYIDFVRSILDPQKTLFHDSRVVSRLGLDTDGQKNLRVVLQSRQKTVIFDDRPDVWRKVTQGDDALVFLRAFRYLFLSQKRQELCTYLQGSGSNVPVDYDTHLHATGRFLQRLHRRFFQLKTSTPTTNLAQNSVRRGIMKNLRLCIVGTYGSAESGRLRDQMTNAVTRFGATVENEIHAGLHLVVMVDQESLNEDKARLAVQRGLPQVMPPWMSFCFATHELQDPRPFYICEQGCQDFWEAHAKWPGREGDKLETGKLVFNMLEEQRRLRLVQHDSLNGSRPLDMMDSSSQRRSALTSKVNPQQSSSSKAKTKGDPHRFSRDLDGWSPQEQSGEVVDLCSPGA
eukprot:TRINITY_DN8798_c0_g1_i1.p1 TRINITY_DN8798_c0_g1~~TRINITY_DN8798_c0_g1_i1.p1  ORF type:complete len:782 (-),score=150.18 TRINITY_DN8798_c0_g1_i1:1-2346(-)